MTAYKKYSEFLLEKSRPKEMYSFILDDIQIDVNSVIDELKKFQMSTWFIYNTANSFSLGYYISSDDSPDNITKITKFLFDELPYFRSLSCYDDDHRLVLKFVEPGDPVRFKFYH
jgi:hypothetical protein